MMASTKGKSALVIGGSMAGLLAARVLSEHFEHVTILERDPVQNIPQSRKGQPQTRHLHGLLVEGLKIVTRYFPDLLQGLQTDGVQLMDMAQTMQWYCYGGYRATFEFGMKGIITSRPYLEWQIRQRVLALPNVTLKDGCAVKKLIPSEENNQQIAGAEISITGQETKPEILQAALIIDASGRGSRTPKWLEDLGYKKPQESTVTCGVGYATRLYERTLTQSENLKWIFVTPQAPKQRRAGGVFPIEGNRWMIGLAGWHGDHAPSDEEGFNAFAKSLPAPDVYNVITRSKPISDIVSYKFPASLRHHYEKMDQFPGRFLVLGDAVCSFNPFYGQGMTSAAMQAVALDTLLRENSSLDNLEKPYFKQVAKIVDIPWQTAVGEDFRFPETKGRKAPGTDLINAYIDRVHQATHHDTVVGAAFLKVMNMIEPPASLLSPRILWRVVKHSLQKN
jgi:2-polyprenyl-6-methoxyphenol hydroxylase-like FAD-dependent oxidoreductase